MAGVKKQSFHVVLLCCLLSGTALAEEAANSINCSGFIQSSSKYQANVLSSPIECGSSIYGDRHGPQEYQQLSCCSGDGRYFVQTGKIGGFDYEEDIVGNAKCHAYLDALAGLLCDPQQGTYVEPMGNSTDVGSVFRICQSACDAVFEACGLPGETLSTNNATFENGTSLCQELWGGFGYSDPCEKEPLGFPCQIKLEISIVSNSSDCLDIKTPTSVMIDHYVLWSEPMSTCEEASVGAALFTTFILLAGVCCCSVCCFSVCYFRQVPPVHGRFVAANTASPTMITGSSRHSSHSVFSERNYATVYDNANPMRGPDNMASLQAIQEQTEGSRSMEMPSPSNTPRKAAANISLAKHLKSCKADNAQSTIQEWSESNPGAACALFPRHVAEALSTITDQEKQSEFAREIARTITASGGEVTCLHVKEALKKCAGGHTFGIAKAMAPSVVDPRNKEIVLAQMDGCTYEEKYEVERCFVV